MTCLHRALLLSSLAAGLALGGACARSDMGLSLGAGSTGGTTEITDTSTGTGEAGTTGASGGALGGQGGSTVATGGGGAGGVARSSTSSTAGAGGAPRSSTPVNTAPLGGRGGTGGTGGAGGASGSICSEVTCLSSLFARCQPTGTCTVQEITTAANPDKVTTNYCFSDGSKEQYIEDYTGDNSVFTTTVKRNNATCYSLVKTEPANGGTPSYVFQNAGGNQVATATQDASGVLTVTCNGGKATTVSATCSSYASTGPDTNSCDDGNCTY